MISRHNFKLFCVFSAGFVSAGLVIGSLVLIPPAPAEAVTPWQAIGGAIILWGIVLARRGSR